MNRTWQVGILSFDEVEALDLAGPYEVFTTANRMHLRSCPDAAPLFQVSCVARTLDPIRARAGMRLLPTHAFADAPPLDVLVVPGGVVHALLQCDETLRWVASASASAAITASVCTGAFVLAASGVLKTGAVTTHWEDQAELAQAFPELDVRANVRWVDQGRIVTSGGITAGIDMSLHLVQRLAGVGLAERTAHQMEYVWTRD